MLDFCHTLSLRNNRAPILRRLAVGKWFLPITKRRTSRELFADVEHIKRNKHDINLQHVLFYKLIIHLHPETFHVQQLILS